MRERKKKYPVFGTSSEKHSCVPFEKTRRKKKTYIYRPIDFIYDFLRVNNLSLILSLKSSHTCSRLSHDAPFCCDKNLYSLQSNSRTLTVFLAYSTNAISILSTR